jgi:glycosyltransferase involved in cell wall biosynthesis
LTYYESGRVTAGVIVSTCESHPAYSIVIPAFNEASRIGNCLTEVLSCLDSQGWNAEVIVVNDGSRDRTATIVQEFIARDPRIRLVENPGNCGKGYSVRRGFQQSCGEIVMFTDADLSAPMEEAGRLFAAVHDGADIAIGSRWLESTRQTIRQPWYRQLFGRCFNLLTRGIMGLHYADTQCGFKAFRRDAALRIARLQRIERWGFDPEMLFLAGKMGYSVREVPVTWAHDERSRLSYLKDGMKMIEDMARIRWYSLTGAYDVSAPAGSPDAAPATLPPGAHPAPKP